MRHQFILYLFAVSVCGELLGNSGELAGGELSHAGIVDVVHEVGGGVITGLIGAGVDGAGASVVGLLLGGGILDTITSHELSATSLEGMVETHPMADLVGTGITLVVVLGGSTGE